MPSAFPVREAWGPACGRVGLTRGHVRRWRRMPSRPHGGCLLVRLGGYAVGVFAGSPSELVSSKTGSRPVHGRSAAGGWSSTVSPGAGIIRPHRAARGRRCRGRVFGRYGADGLERRGARRDKRAAPGSARCAAGAYLDRAVDRFLTCLTRGSPCSGQPARLPGHPHPADRARTAAGNVSPASAGSAQAKTRT